MRALFLALLCCSTLALGACAKPGATDAPATAGSAPDTRTPPTARAPAVPADQAPPASDPLPPERVPVAGNYLEPDLSCRTSADCAVKNVGNCCGMMPACVNKGAAVDPSAVKAQCEREGRMSVCGFKDVQACACVAGTCEDAEGAVAQ